eukprot:gene8509-10002_t
MRYSAPATSTEPKLASLQQFASHALDKTSTHRSSTVANTPSAKKRAKQAEKRRSHNASLRSMVRTYIKNVVKAIDAKDAEKAQAAYVLAVPVIDRMADKGIIHKNKAARHKGRLNGHIKALNLAAAA